MLMAESRPTLKSILIYVCLFFLVWTIRATVLFRVDASIASEVWRNVYSNVVKFVVWVGPVFFYLRRVDGREPFRYLKLSTRPERSGLPRALVVVIVYFSLVLIISLFVQGKRVSLNFNAVALASTAVSSLSEEIMFRGFLLNELRERVRFRSANLLTAILFALIHVPNWLWTRGFQMSLLFDLVGVFALACLLGYLLKRTNTLWVCVGAHVFNNFLSSLLRG
ncbi:MAG: protease family protein [Acidobacteriota bacterium]|nr:protease family protein [Acidobacteriota bacterium]